MNKISAFTFLIFSSFTIFSQNLDSPLTVVKNTKNDSVKVRMYNRIGSAYIFRNPNTALQIIKEGEEMAEEKKFHFGLTELVNTHGIYMDVTGKSDSANYYFSRALEMSRKHGFKNIEIMCINNLGMFHWNRNNHNEALKYFFDALKMNDEIGNEKQSAIYLNNIGLIYQVMNIHERALNYHQQALDIREKYNLREDLAVSLNNVGIDLKNLGRLDEAITTYQRGMKVAQETNNLVEYYRVLDNLGNAYQLKGDTKKAIETFLKALDRPENFDDDEKVTVHIYSSLSSLYNLQNDPQKGFFTPTKVLKFLKNTRI